MKKMVFWVLVVFLIGAVSSANETTTIKNDFASKSNAALEKEVKIPDNMQNVVKFIFGMKDKNPLDLQHIVILIVLWVILFTLIRELMSFTPFFEGWKSLLGGIIVTLLASISGGVLFAANFFFYIGNTIDFLQKNKLIQLSLNILILFIFVFGATILLRNLKKKMTIAENEREGFKIGSGI